MSLISYYNPDPKKNKTLCTTTLEQIAEHEPKVIIAGDFNQMIDSDIHFLNLRDKELKPETIIKKKKKSQNFNELVEKCNLFHTKGDNNLFTFESN